jgi:hypothetical protein
VQKKETKDAHQMFIVESAGNRVALTLSSFALQVFWLLVAASPANAWEIFGPSNYEECVVEKMKGQDKSMVWRVEEACEIKFPFERETGLRDGENFKWNWELRPNGKVALLIAKNDTVWSITRAKLLLFEGDCNAVPAPNARSAHADLVASVFSSELTASLSSPGTYSCAAAKFWGKRRK